MRSIITAIIVSGFVACGSIVAHSETTNNTGSYSDAMRKCGAEWRASEARNNAKKGERAAAWQSFRAECTKRVGWTKKSRAASK